MTDKNLVKKPNRDLEPTKIYLPKLLDIQQEIHGQIQRNVTRILSDTLKDMSQKYQLNWYELKTNYIDPITTELNESISNNTNTSDNGNSKTKTNKKVRNLDPSEICMARVSSGNQCSRKRQIGHDYCGSHILRQPNGRIDEPQQPIVTTPKKRGRPKGSGKKNKTNGSGNLSGYGSDTGNGSVSVSASDNLSGGLSSDIQDSFSDHDSNTNPDTEPDSVEVKFDVIEINGQNYITDELGNIYEYPENETEAMDIDDLVVVGKMNNDENGNADYIFYKK